MTTQTDAKHRNQVTVRPDGSATWTCDSCGESGTAHFIPFTSFDGEPTRRASTASGVHLLLSPDCTTTH